MSVIKAGDISKGMFLLENGAPFQVQEREFVKPGKGSAFVRLKLKNLIDGSAQRVTHKSQDNIEEIEVEEHRGQYLYAEEQLYHFMNSETFEPIDIERASMPDLVGFLLEGEIYRLLLWADKVLEVRLPPKVDLVVTQASEGLKGDTVSGASKVVQLETGLSLKVPLFIKQGDKIRVNVENKEYLERVNNS